MLVSRILFSGTNFIDLDTGKAVSELETALILVNKSFGDVERYTVVYEVWVSGGPSEVRVLQFVSLRRGEE